MEPANAFVGHLAMPTPMEVASALGRKAGLWREIVQLCAQQGVAETEWKSVSPKYGWSLRLQQRKRTIVYLSPCDGCIRVAFVLGNQAVEAARSSDLVPEMLALIDRAPRYAEGTGLVFFVKRKSDLVAVKTLVSIKLEN